MKRQVDPCAIAREFLVNYQIGDIPKEFAEALANHLGECRECMRFLQATSLSDAMIADALERSTVQDVRSVARRARRTGYLKHPLVWGVALASSAVLGFWYAAPALLAWRFPGAENSLMKPEFQVEGIDDADIGFEGARVDSHLIGDWQVSGDLAGGFATVDNSVSHSGQSSLRLAQRNGSGSLELDLPIDLPAGTGITYGAWVYSPRGGSFENKAFQMSVKTPEQGSIADITDLLSSPVWRPEILHTNLAKPTRMLGFVLSTSAGGGMYRGWDWATWVDDVYLGVVIRFRGDRIVTGDGAVVDAVLPVGFSSDQVEPDSIELIEYGAHPRRVRGNITKSERGLRMTFRGKDAREIMTESNPDTGLLSTPNVMGRFKVGRYQMAFECGVADGVNGPSQIKQPRR